MTFLLCLDDFYTTHYDINRTAATRDQSTKTRNYCDVLLLSKLGLPVAVIRQLTTISFQTTILKAHQEFGVASIRAYSTLDREEMETDPKIPDPPTYMKLHGREALPRFTAQSLG